MPPPERIAPAKTIGKEPARATINIPIACTSPAASTVGRDPIRSGTDESSSLVTTKAAVKAVNTAAPLPIPSKSKSSTTNAMKLPYASATIASAVPGHSAEEGTQRNRPRWLRLAITAALGAGLAWSTPPTSSASASSSEADCSVVFAAGI